MTDDNFLPDAACRGYSIELWFPPAFDEDPTGTDSEYWEVGKMVCSVCKHRPECREMGEAEKYGLWGGATPSERRRGISRPSKRHMSTKAWELLPKTGERVDINPLRQQLRSGTRKRQPVS